MSYKKKELTLRRINVNDRMQRLAGKFILLLIIYVNGSRSKRSYCLDQIHSNKTVF